MGGWKGGPIGVCIGRWVNGWVDEVVNDFMVGWMMHG